MITIKSHKGAVAISVQGEMKDVACEFATLLKYLDEHPKIKYLANLIAKNGKIPNNKMSHEELEKAIEQAAKRLVDSLRKLAEDDEK